jgi:hypothetical protein
LVLRILSLLLSAGNTSPQQLQLTAVHAYSPVGGRLKVCENVEKIRVPDLPILCNWRTLAFMKVSSWLNSEKHRQLVERWWIALVLLWDVGKTFVVDKAFGKYGVNPYGYFFIVIAVAVPYAITSAKMLFAIIANNWRRAAIFGTAAVVLHFVSDIYILINAKQVPKSIFNSFIIAVVVLSIFAVHGVVSQVRAHRKRNK